MRENDLKNFNLWEREKGEEILIFQGGEVERSSIFGEGKRAGKKLNFWGRGKG